MSERIKDYTILLLATAALLVQMLILMGELRIISIPYLDNRDRAAELPIGRVTERSRSVRARSEGSLTWYPVITGDPIHWNDTLMTGQFSEAILQVEGSGSIRLGPETLLYFSRRKVERGETKLTLEVVQGEVKVAAVKPIALRVGKQHLSLQKDSELVIRQPTASEVSRIEVAKGKVTVDEEIETSDDVELPVVIPKRELQSGEVAQLSPAAPVKKVKLHLDTAPVFPTSDQRLIASRGESQEIVFQWSGDKGEVEIASNADFTDKVSLKRTEDTGVRGMVSVGKHFWRVRAEEAVGPVATFTLLPHPDYFLQAPNPINQIALGKAVQFQWKGLKQAKGYRLEIAKDANFSSIVHTAEVSSTGYQWVPKETGVYHWRLHAEHETLGSWPTSTAKTFTVRPPVKAPKLKGVRVLEEQSGSPDWWERIRHRVIPAIVDWVIPSAIADEVKIPVDKGKGAKSKKLALEFSWEPVPGAAAYVLEVATDREFRDIVATQETEALSLVVKLPRKEKYFWRVAAKDEEGEVSRYSESDMMLPPEPVIVVKPPPPPPEPPKPKPPPPPSKKAEPKRVAKTEHVFSLGHWEIALSPIVASRNEQLTDGDYNVSSTGWIAGTKISAAVAAWGEFVELSVEGMSIKYKTAETTLQSRVSNANQTPLNIQLNWKEKHLTHTTRWTAGIGYVNLVDVERTDAASVRPKLIGSLTINGGAQIYLTALTKTWELQTTTTATLIALGDMKGLGAELSLEATGPIVDNRYYLTIGARASPWYYKINSTNRHTTRIDFGPRLDLIITL